MLISRSPLWLPMDPVSLAKTLTGALGRQQGRCGSLIYGFSSGSLGELEGVLSGWFTGQARGAPHVIFIDAQMGAGIVNEPTAAGGVCAFARRSPRKESSKPQLIRLMAVFFLVGLAGSPLKRGQSQQGFNQGPWEMRLLVESLCSDGLGFVSARNIEPDARCPFESLLFDLSIGLPRAYLFGGNPQRLTL